MFSREFICSSYKWFMQFVSSMSIISRYANHRRDKGDDFSKLTVAGLAMVTICVTHTNASKLLNFKLKISVPNGYEPDKYTLDKFGENVELCEIPGSAVDGADVVTTDVWASMGDEHENEERKSI